jgi:DNA-binding response OmpR family regulator
MKAVILVVEDQLAMQRNMRMSLEISGYKVVTASDGIEALTVLDSEPVDLVLADIAMPRLNGYQLYERLRENPKWNLLPFVFISARALDSDVRYGKALGVDDYLVKPFQLEDLLAVVAGRLRRAREVAQVVAQSIPQKVPVEPVRQGEVDSIVVGSIRLSPKQHRVWQDGMPVDLSPREFAILEYLARQPGEVVSLTELCRVTHGLDLTVIEAGNLLYPLVRSLRRRLGNSAGEMGCIESVRGIGYRLTVPA